MSVMAVDYLNKPDKRKKKTSLFQYKQYLKALEEDEIFRTGFIPPGRDANYLSLKWKELADKLNEDDKGPKLSAEEWKKRLMDWKHTTRAKERRINEGNTHLRMTPLEVRFMELWGCVPTIINISSIKTDSKPSDIKIEKSNETEKIFEEALEEPETKQDIATITAHELQLLSSASQSQLQSVPPSHEIKVVEQIQITAPEKKPQVSNDSINLEQTTTHATSVAEKKNENNRSSPPPLKRVRMGNISQAHITQIPISIANGNDFNETNNLTSNANTAMTVTSTTIPAQISTTRENLQILTQTLTAPQANNLHNTPEIAYTINTLPQENDSIPVIDVQNIASQIKRLADIKEQKLRFEIEKFKFKNPGFQYNF
ncbi:uncharacterized protein LOC129607536 isoform X2 [Condylostylus longicornis]|uniref:uncharacterized protein LOC129607536 isoform X2 n=1 Tax=Condylostylus longicornis TaxID=2530218 RepID=UPI00244DC1E1|nr:uncharacterized protein LOC129607536 isoform X2 [Condylostylus longicornis]